MLGKKGGTGIESKFDKRREMEMKTFSVQKKVQKENGHRKSQEASHQLLNTLKLCKDSCYVRKILSVKLLF